MSRALRDEFESLERRRLELTARVRGALEAAPDALDHAPIRGGWTLGQVIQHLYLVEVEGRARGVPKLGRA